MTPSDRCAGWGWSGGAEPAALGAALELLLPAQCAACAGPARAPLCDACLAGCRAPAGPSCPACGASWSAGGACGRCRRFGRPFAFAAAAALWRYGGVVRRLVHGAKYGGRREDLFVLGRRMAREPRLACLVGAAEPAVVVPIPLRRASRRRRGYDQALELARGFAAEARLPLEPAGLARRRQGPAQTGRPLAVRRAQARAAFAGSPLRLGGRSVVLVDDVLSTGATADAAARAARLAGARGVVVATLAT